MSSLKNLLADVDNAAVAAAFQARLTGMLVIPSPRLAPNQSALLVSDEIYARLQEMAKEHNKKGVSG